VKYVLTRLNPPRLTSKYILEESDMWGLESALQHLIGNTNYFQGQNLEWAKAMAAKIEDLRGLKPE